MTLAARRARQINSYFNQLGEGLGHMVPPQVSSVARKPLSIGFEEIAADKIVRTELPDAAELVEDEPDGRATVAVGDGDDHRLSLVRPCCAGRRIVLGVTGGIAAYKAVEVCRRLVDAGAHVVPVMTEGRRALHRPHDVVGAGQRAGADRACGTRPARSRTPASARPPT